ncbi:hypothetical protein P59_037 [Bacillus phage P59]|nr:hypothetical protein P59_037 [Bacillus phage P59]
MKSTVFTFFYKWGNNIKESWGFLLAIVLIYLGVEMIVKNEAYGEMFTTYPLLSVIWAMIVVVGLFYIGTLLLLTLILTGIQYAVGRAR